MSAKAKPFEVHEHSYIEGPNAQLIGRNTFRHSHEGGNHSDGGHKHQDTGPALFDIDKDEWYAATGLKGGGRKSFTATPSGPELPLVALEDWQRTFAVVLTMPIPEDATDADGAAVARLVLGSAMTPHVEDASTPDRPSAAPLPPATVAGRRMGH